MHIVILTAIISSVSVYVHSMGCHIRVINGSAVKVSRISSVTYLVFYRPIPNYFWSAVELACHFLNCTELTNKRLTQTAETYILMLHNNKNTWISTMVVIRGPTGCDPQKRIHCCYKSLKCIK